MRKLKRFASVLLALVMCFGLTVTAFADSYTLTITDAEAGYEYTAYQVFSGTLSDDKLTSIEWGEDIGTTDASAIYTALAAIEVDGSYPFRAGGTATGAVLTSASEVAAALAQDTTTDNTVAKKFADVIASYIKSDATGTKSGAYNSTDESYTITVSDAGYYLVKTTDMPDDGADTDNSDNGGNTRYILLQTLTGGASINDKSSAPTIDKDLSDVDANIGDTITYYLTATLPETYIDYSTYELVFHDTLSKGLTFVDGSVNVYVYTTGTDYAYDKDVSDGTLVKNSTSNYTVGSVTTDQSTGESSFSVTIDDTKTLTDSDDSTISTSSASRIVVTFQAKLNSDAVIGGDGNPNEVYLEYSNNPNSGGSGETGTTPEDKVVTWTYELDVTKVDGSNTSTTLPGAKFKLYRLNSSSQKEYVVLTDGKVSSWTTTEADGSVLTSDSSGIFTVVGLDVGTYYLTETEAPSGYNKLTTDTTLVIAATYTKTDSDTPTDDDVTLNTLTITVDSGTAANGTTLTGVVEATVKNNKGASLPSTGGIGTTIFYVVGGVLVVGAVVLLITRKRMQDDQ